MTTGSKKTTRGKKTAAKPRKTRAKKDDGAEVVEDELQAEAPPPKTTKGRKRGSDEMDSSVLTISEAPAPKKRATKARVSNTVDSSILSTVSQDVEMSDAPAKKPAAKKKGGRTSNAKTTTKSKTQGPDDDELDRQLQADLDRPLTDDEEMAGDSGSEKKRPVGRPRKGTVSKKAAPPAKSQDEPMSDFAMFDPAPVEPDEDEMDAELKAMEVEMKTSQKAELLEIPKKGRKAGPRKVSKQQTKKAKEAAELAADSVDELADDQIDLIQIPATAASTTKQAEAPAPVPEKDVVRDDIKTVSEPTSAPVAAEPSRAVSAVTVEVQIKSSRESFSTAKPTSGKVVASVVSPTLAPRPLPSLPPVHADEHRSPNPPATPAGSTAAAVHIPSATPSAQQPVLSPSQSPQSSDAENQPPSSRPATANPPSARSGVMPPGSATASRAALVPVATPTRSNMRVGQQRLQSTAGPWTAVDLDLVFASFSPGAKGSGDRGKENKSLQQLLRAGDARLSTPEKDMTVEEWIYYNAGLAETKLKAECEAMVSAFEREGGKAMRVLEGLVVE
jgi:hypothetical protein